MVQQEQQQFKLQQEELKQEQDRSAKLAAKLRDLGIDPDNL
jgi:hypothetical protein